MNTTSLLVQALKPAPFVPPDLIVTGYMRTVIEIAFDLCICATLSLVGVVTNILDLAVFARQGYKTTVNISMSFIAFFDLVKSLSGLAHRLYGPLLLYDAALAKTWENYTRGSLAFVQTFAVYTCSVLAGYVAVERCLCVLIPFSVKTLLTPRVTWVAMATISIVTNGSFWVVYAFYDYGWDWSPTFNATIGIFKYSEFYWRNLDLVVTYYNVMGIVWPFTSLVIIFVSTVVITYQLRKSSQFRNTSKATSKIPLNAYSTSSEKNESITFESNTSRLSPRDKQVVKMLLAIIVIYIIALLPRIILFIAKCFEPELYFFKKYHNLFFVLAYSLFILDFINSTVNFFIYIAMSSQFRATLMDMFRPNSSKRVHSLA
ncbi:hypothetical protein BgiMline_004114 [Biomphalaria glabrata]|nr:neuropeptide receptor 15-like [Biomphalaria glabrata]